MSRTTIVNPAALRRPVKHVEEGTCIYRADAPVCENGDQDVACTGEVYRGCAVGQADCANNPDNPDDTCCAAVIPGTTGDNIDHAYCSINDAGYGGIGVCFWSDTGNKPPEPPVLCAMEDWTCWLC